MTEKAAAAATREQLEGLVAEADTGGRRLRGFAAKTVMIVAVAWSLFQLWYASPLPFLFGVGILGDTEARAFHLSFAVFLTFACYPAFSSSRRDRVPLIDIAFGAVAIACVLYLVVFYRDLVQRPGLPTTMDIVVSVLGVVLLIEASRRAEGPWMPVISLSMLLYVFAGPYLPGLLSHKGASLGRAASHFWLTSEGVFGVALGVSTSFIFLFVLFGALLDKAGAGNFFIQVAFSLLGKYRGGPAKAAVVSSGMTGMISGSSVANVVTTGTFTIPLMKRVGYTPTQAGAIECAAGVNGQLMPPVMGAAAFIMAEYVGITYADVVRHAIIPALLTYGALFYVVDLEAVKAGMTGLPGGGRRTLREALIKATITICSLIIFSGAIYWGFGWTRQVFGASASWVALAFVVTAYVALVANRARYPDLPADDLTRPATIVPDFYETVRTGLHYLLPVSVLIWCLMIEEMSPGLAAFWGVMAMAGLVLTQKPLTAFFRRQGNIARQFRESCQDLIAGLELGGRNMAAVGIATATAGIMVGTVTLTGVGLVMTEIVEFLSGGNIVIMLTLVGVICILLGTGLPTTASYVVVATLMAPVVVELAAENDLAVPLIAVHMFVFYFGLMADVSPPVGLAAYAAAAIAGADPMRVGWQGTWYEFRTVLLPFIFIFNPEILLIDIGGPIHFVVVIGCAVLAMMAFVAALQGFFFAPNRWWETALLLLICFTLFRPNFWMDRVIPPFRQLAASEVIRVIDETPGAAPLRLRVLTQDMSGDDSVKAIRLNLGAKGDAKARLAESGMILSPGSPPTITSVRPGSEAARLRLRPGDRIEAVTVPNERPSPFLFALPALAALLGIGMLQRRRRPLRVVPA
ncbi:MAG: TRAP transporter permease [Bacteroidota bacterium]|jgi:TRAP transporter 4TM/12TM fusion protein